MSITKTREIFSLPNVHYAFFFFTSMLGTSIACASLWLLLVTVPFGIAMHFTILGEERYCEQTYGKEYLEYKANTPRYLLWG